MKKICICLPVYNEAENIEPFIEALLGLINKIEDFDFEILVVDDYSPDGTGDIVKLLTEKYGKLKLVKKNKEGLGSAYIYGFDYAIKELNPDYIAEMDSDFSHRPEDLPRLLEGIRSGADMVIGSRYIPGGTVPADWGILRKLNSSVANILVRHAAGIRKIKDCTGGFRIISAKLLKKISLKSLNANGYSFQIALLYRLLKLQAVILEVPIQFQNRNFGESKLGIKDIIEFIKVALLLRFGY